jgi:hypothetical protein
MVFESDQAMAAQCSGQLAEERANTARSAHSRRGLGLVRRSAATSWRSTTSSTSLVVDVRPRSKSSPSRCRKIRYSRRSDTAEIMPVAGDHQSLLVSGRCNVLEPHRVQPAEELAEDQVERVKVKRP